MSQTILVFPYPVLIIYVRVHKTEPMCVRVVLVSVNHHYSPSLCFNHLYSLYLCTKLNLSHLSV